MNKIQRWLHAGEELSDEELKFVLDNDLEPGYHDHSTSELLEAFRAGHRAASYQVRLNNAHADSLYDADPDCDHEIQLEWSGVQCKKCTGWYCL